MVNQLAKRVRAIQILADLLAITSAWYLSYWIRFELIGSAQTGLEKAFAFWLLPLLLITVYFLIKHEQYDRPSLRSSTEDIMRLFRANALSVVAFIIFLYFVSDSRISRATLLIYSSTSTLLLVFVRLCVRSMIRKLRRRGELVQKVFVVGDGPQIPRYLRSIDYTPGTGLKVVAAFGSNFANLQVPSHGLGALESMILSDRPDLIVLGFEEEAPPFVAEFIRRHYDDLIKIQVLTAENQSLLGLTSEMSDGVHIMTLNEPRFSSVELAAKRSFDIVASFLGLLVLSPFLSALAIMVRLSSPGPIFFGQERVGIAGQTFKMWKFRSMRTGSLEESKGWTVENDPRRTKFGTFIRKTSLDELPQLWNVLVGDMSLVGPRPEQTHFVEKFRNEIPAYMLRHKMKAGITGWAQVSGWRGDTSLHKRIECDLFYIRNWSFWLDIKILALTVIRGFINKNAY